ncbi:MAG: tetratricopeptide repeat protein, partial [Planctomycetia bacterium]|nr:tetratricopeptide repeat protein [Planctomycetia bacterium]
MNSDEILSDTTSETDHGTPEISDGETHPVDNPGFLERLDANVICEEEHRKWMEHLCGCEHCCRIVSRLVGVDLLFTDTVEEKTIPSGQKRSLWRMTDSVRQKRWQIPVACAVIFCICLSVFLMSGRSTDAVMDEMAMRMSQEFSQQSPCVTDNGYRLNGTSWVKTISSVAPQQRELADQGKELLKKYPDNIPLRVTYGKFLLFALHDPEGAIRELERAKILALTPSGMSYVAEIHQMLGLAEFEAGNDTAAQEHFRNVLDLEPENVDAKINLAVSLYRSGAQDQAILLLQELRSQGRLSELLHSQLNRLPE